MNSSYDLTRALVAERQQNLRREARARWLTRASHTTRRTRNGSRSSGR